MLNYLLNVTQVIPRSYLLSLELIKCFPGNSYKKARIISFLQFRGFLPRKTIDREDEEP